MFLLIVRVMPAQTGENVTFTTSDDVVIAGTLWNAGSGTPAVICLHQWRSDRQSFIPLANKLAASGLTVLAIDSRGYGGSKRTASGSSVRPDRLTQNDIVAAVSYLNGAASPASIGIVGASYGSSNAIMYAAKASNVKMLVLLSPGINYFNVLPTLKPIKKLSSTKILAIASSEDLRSIEAVTRYSELLGSNISTKIYPDVGHGTDMLAGNKKIETYVATFILKAMR